MDRKLKERDGKKFVVVKGIEIQVVSNEECAKCDYHVCMRVADMEVPCMGSSKDRCCDCNEEIWYDARHPAGPKKICTRCLMKHKDDEHLSA